MILIFQSESYRVSNIFLRGMKNNSFSVSNKASINQSKVKASIFNHNTMFNTQARGGNNLIVTSMTASNHEQIIPQQIPLEVPNKAITTGFPWKKTLLLATSFVGMLIYKSNPTIASTGGLASLIDYAKLTDTGFLQSFSIIFVSELGDKTFFIASLLAAKYGRFVSFTGSLAALSVMTIISVVIGQLFHAVPSSISKGIPFDDYIAVAAFAYFGVKTLYEAIKMDPEDKSGLEGEQAEAEELINEVSTKESNTNAKKSNIIKQILQTFSLVFAGEIGDKSFLSTIALSAALNPFAVAFGAIAAHGVATAVAVIGGAFMSKYLSEKLIGYIGGSLFIIFAITTAFGLF